MTCPRSHSQGDGDMAEGHCFSFLSAARPCPFCSGASSCTHTKALATAQPWPSAQEDACLLSHFPHLALPQSRDAESANNRGLVCTSTHPCQPGEVLMLKHCSLAAWNWNLEAPTGCTDRVSTRDCGASGLRKAGVGLLSSMRAHGSSTAVWPRQILGCNTHPKTPS